MVYRPGLIQQLKTDIKQQMISRYERGISTLRKILAALHADIVIKADGASSIVLNAA